LRPTRPHQKGFRPRRVKDAAAGSGHEQGAAPAERRGRRETPASSQSERWLYGRHAVAAALANPARRWRRLVALAGHESEAAELAAAARAEKRGAAEPVQVLDRLALETLLPEGAVHQGLALEAEPLAAPDIDDVLRAAETVAGRAILVVLDQVTDPHNVGAVLRSAAAFGALGVIVPEHNAPPASGTLAKAASGALDLVPLVRVVNIARALDQVKAAGFWCCGLDESATELLAAVDLGAKAALVLGSEGGGLRRLVRERCDYLARLPTRPPLASLNVSNAAAIALYEMARGG
jgi:23S rRNA (guanosine2251-2'-O)-methyltransferase